MRKDVIFDEALTTKPTDSQQVKSKKTTEIPQHVESDATPHTPSSSVSLEFPPIVTPDENHIVDKDTEDIENQEHVIGQIHDSIAVGRGRRNPQKPHGSLQICLWPIHSQS